MGNLSLDFMMWRQSVILIRAFWCRGRKESLLYMDSREKSRREIIDSNYGQLF